MEAAHVVPIDRIEPVSSRHVLLEFRNPALRGYEPGQFVMVWVPGVDEVPMALFGGEEGRFRILVEAKGDCTRALAAKKAGDLIGLRGPYGRGFQVRGRRLLIVVGGTGTSPLVPLCERHRGRIEVDVVIGGRTREFLLLVEDYRRAGARVHVATDDGSEGFHGRAPDLARQLLDRHTYDDVLTCGPERMMHAVVEECARRGIPVQASLERWMKCAVGICDACLVDGIRLCRDGPVLDRAVLIGLEDFGKYEREPSGVRRAIH